MKLPTKTPDGELTPEGAVLGMARHHIGLFRTIKRLEAAADDDEVRPLAFRPTDASVIDRALRFDRRLPSAAELDDARFRFHEMENSRPASMSEISLVVTILLSSRPNFRPERSEALLHVALELIALIEPPPTMDVVVAGMMAQLESSRFTPDAGEVAEFIREASSRSARIAKQLPHLIEVRESVNDTELEQWIAAIRLVKGGQCDRCRAVRRAVVETRDAPDQAVAAFRHAEHLAGIIVRHPYVWSAIAEVATELMLRGTLDGDEVHEICARHFPPGFMKLTGE